VSQVGVTVGSVMQVESSQANHAATGTTDPSIFVLSIHGQEIHAGTVSHPTVGCVSCFHGNKMDYKMWKQGHRFMFWDSTQAFSLDKMEKISVVSALGFA